MEKIIVNVNAEIEVTDEEYEHLREIAYEPRNLDIPYNTILAEEWMYEKIKDAKFTGGYLPSDQWITRGKVRFKF